MSFSIHKMNNSDGDGDGGDVHHNNDSAVVAVAAAVNLVVPSTSSYVNNNSIDVDCFIVMVGHAQDLVTCHVSSGALNHEQSFPKVALHQLCVRMFDSSFHNCGEVRGPSTWNHSDSASYHCH